MQHDQHPQACTISEKEILISACCFKSKENRFSLEFGYTSKECSSKKILQDTSNIPYWNSNGILKASSGWKVYLPVTTRTIIFLVGDPYKPSFVTVTGRGPHPRYT